jgi:predicted DNA-binding transcriptional regulator AlpA
MLRPKSDVPELLLDLPRAAAALSLSEHALRCLIARGRGPAIIRIGRRVMFSPADLQAFVEAHRVLPPPPPVFEMSPRRRGRPTKAEQILRDRAAGLEG